MVQMLNMLVFFTDSLDFSNIGYFDNGSTLEIQALSTILIR